MAHDIIMLNLSLGIYNLGYYLYLLRIKNVDLCYYNNLKHFIPD